MAILTAILSSGAIGLMPMRLRLSKQTVKKAKPIAGKKVAYIEISKAGNAAWHIQFYQQPFALTKGKIYTLQPVGEE